MISIPLDTKSSTTLSDLYGNAPYFALLDIESGAFKVIKNEECGNGPQLVPFLKQSGTSATVFSHMGDKLYKYYTKEGIKVFTCKDEKPTIDAIYKDFLSESLLLVDESNYTELTDECSCSCKGE
ncbi:NifB/NifX family molybdenum-iron cluster-binding protein [Sulfurospirillum arcachonense]|uniref:NifB/NifX family molybdenum-iron cluster-binding protein n=1 Tax=Sulfurospirillum arcachonense TaxID=57666 RepID=UPI0004693623|nr:NifB/NifX family molybdenum-iron cluster-binding protein [Sulfurospirillum arcachonense]